MQDHTDRFQRGREDLTVTFTAPTPMHERAAELGGTCRIEPASSGGTRVTAVIPLPTAGAAPLLGLPDSQS